MVSTYKVIYTDEVLEDIDEIISYILNVAWHRSANKWARKFFERTEALAVFPEGNPRYKYDETCRVAKVGKYSIIYEVDKEKLMVIILRIVHSKRDMRKVETGK